MGMEVRSERCICPRCGTAFLRYRGFFPASYAAMHKGTGYVPICRECVDSLYNTYLAQCNDARAAVRQMCRKLDLYWNDKIFEALQKKFSTRSMMSQYISKTATNQYAGKCYDDTLSEEGTLWSFMHSQNNPEESSETTSTQEENKTDVEEVIQTPKEVVDLEVMASSAVSERQAIYE